MANSRTSARHTWIWNPEPERFADDAPREFALLNDLRMPGPWHEPVSDPSTAGKEPVSWRKFQTDVETERGLFKVIALYLDDRLARRGTRSLKEYLDVEESRRFEAGLDLSVLVFDAAITPVIALALGVPTLAIGMALIGLQYGYRRMTDTNRERVGDQFA